MSRLRYGTYRPKKQKKKQKKDEKGSCGEGRRRCRSGERKATRPELNLARA